MQRQRANHVPILGQGTDLAEQAFAADERFAAGQNEGSSPANLIDEFVHLPPGQVVTVRVAELVEAVDGDRDEAVPRQHRRLIVGDAEPQRLQAECDQVLKKGQHPAAALDVQDQRTPRKRSWNPA